MIRAACVTVVGALLCLTTMVAAPASACGCGAYIADADEVAVVDERALIAWDGSEQRTLMAFDVDGTSDRAAWVMPVPATADVDLGDAEVFAEVDRITAPRIEVRDSWWPTFDWLTTSPAAGASEGAAPGGAAVNVLSHQRIGPFDVTRLAAGDATELTEWLADKGFPHPPALDDNVAPYVADGWQIVAVQLTPDAAGGSLSGTLQPLRLTFPSHEVVYPMRLSQSATISQHVDLSVIAEHRMDPTTLPVPDAPPELRYAGRLHRSDVSSTLGDYVGDDAFLTRWSNDIVDPAEISGDYVFAPAAFDTEFQEVVYRDRNRGDITGIALLAAMFLGGLTVTVAFVRMLIRRPQAR